MECHPWHRLKVNRLTPGVALKDSADGKRAGGHVGPQVTDSLFSVRAQLKQSLDEGNKVIIGCESVCRNPVPTLEFLCEWLD